MRNHSLRLRLAVSHHSARLIDRGSNAFLRRMERLVQNFQVFRHEKKKDSEAKKKNQNKKHLDRQLLI